MTAHLFRRSAGAVALAILLTACEDGQPSLTEPDADVVAARGVAAVTETREVERADIFSAAEPGLWDGRPSLGGVWVAHPDVAEPESVRITNSDTGMTTRGALFRRERNNPGPRIQVSSDAAASLGMLAGSPAPLEIVVIRTETVEIAPAVEPAPAAEVDAEVEVEASSVDASAPVAAAAATATTAVSAGDEVLPMIKPARWSPFRRRAVAPVATTDPDENADASLAPASVETEPLDTIAVAAAAIEEAEAEAAAPAAATGGYVQIGLFSVEANADAAATSLRQSGIVPTVKPLTRGDSTLWRVLVGPVASADEQTALLAQVKALGYGDAYVTQN